MPHCKNVQSHYFYNYRVLVMTGKKIENLNSKKDILGLTVLLQMEIVREILESLGFAEM